MPADALDPSDALEPALPPPAGHGAALPTESQRAVHASLLGAALGVALALWARRAASRDSRYSR